MKQIFFLILTLISITKTYSQEITDRDLEKLYNQKQYQKVLELGKVKLEKEPLNVTANHLVGRILADNKNFKEAIPYLKASIQPDSPDYTKSWSNAYLGKCYYILDSITQSKNNLRKAFDLNATENSTKFALKYLKAFQMTSEFDGWEIIEKKHIRFHFQPNNNIENLEDYCNQRVEAYKKNNEFFKAKPYKKIDFFIWSNPDDAIKYFGKPLGFTNSELCIINSLPEQTLGHEITHILTSFGIKPKIKNELINEGVAVAFDLTKRNRIQMAKKSNPTNLSIQQIMKNNKEISDEIIYPVGGALIEFLRNNADDETLKKLIHEQTYENLISLYGENMIKKFEELIKN